MKFEKILQNRVPKVRTVTPIPLPNGIGDFVTFEGLNDEKEHFAIGFGNWKENTSPLIRIHSECITGDIFGSEKCDCGDQLKEALSKLQKENGILLYLRQEGRGIGLYKKLEAYLLQDAGLDTYDANRALGLPEDAREYGVAQKMLCALAIRKIRLLSNNPDKQDQLRNHGIEVLETFPTGAFVKPCNKSYLAAKVNKTGHQIQLGV